MNKYFINLPICKFRQDSYRLLCFFSFGEIVLGGETQRGRGKQFTGYPATAQRTGNQTYLELISGELQKTASLNKQRKLETHTINKGAIVKNRTTVQQIHSAARKHQSTYSTSRQHTAPVKTQFTSFEASAPS
jgi:hypothetical protein